MNPSFIKMLRFEYKSNHTLWIYSLIIAFSILGIFFYTMSKSSNIFGFKDLYFILFSMITWLFTLHSYQESTTNQSMQMYHLISVSRHVKFFSKQFITLVAFPMILIVASCLIIAVINLFNLAKEDVLVIFREVKVLLWILIWILGQSISTLLAIVFKKNKILYALLVYLVTRIVLGIVVLILVFTFKSLGFLESSHFSDNKSFWELIGLTGVLAITVLFYSISYHLFFKRQL